MLQQRNFRSGRLNALIGLGVISNLTLSIGLLPWLTLSAQGQAVLLETNPNPDAPSFEIPTEVAPAPTAHVTPEVAYEPEPYIAPEPNYEPDPYFESAPEPFVEPAPAPAPEVVYEPEPYVEVAPLAPPPAPVSPPEPTYISPAPASGCAALLISLNADCGPSPTEIEVKPSIPQPLTSPQIANENLKAPSQATIPPARQVHIRTAVAPAIPPARQLTATVPGVHASPRDSRPVIPHQTPLPTYRELAAPPTAVPSPPAGNGIVTATVPSLPPSPSPSFTAVKPDRYALKPLNSRNPLDWILGSQPMLFPLPMPVAVSSAFGWRQHPIQQSWHLHSGIDFAAPQGTPVVAAYDGQVAIANRVGGYGLTVLLSHNQGQRQTRYAHLSQIFVRPGQMVSQGDVLGAVGSTGNSTGPHLHFETLVKTPDGMVIVDPTEEVKTALIKTLERMQAIAQQNQTTGKTDVIPAAPISAEPSTPTVQTSPIPVEVIQPMSRYQANADFSVPLLTE